MSPSEGGLQGWAGLHVEKRVSQLNQPTNLKEGGRWSGLTNEESVGLEVVSQGTVCRDWANRGGGASNKKPQRRGKPAVERKQTSLCQCEGEHKSLVWRCRPLQHRFTAFLASAAVCCSITMGGWSAGLSPLTCTRWPNGNQHQLVIRHYGLAAGSRPTGRGETNGQGTLASQLIGKPSRRVADRSVSYRRSLSVYSILDKGMDGIPSARY